MYSSSYPRAKLGLDAREHLHRPRGKSCGYYLRIVFFFSSLIQSLIIASLVLFLVYGQPEKSAEELRVKDLEQGYNHLSENNIRLRKEKAELGAQLGGRTAEKGALEKELEKMKTAANVTAKAHQDEQKKLTKCVAEKGLALLRCATQPQCPPMHNPFNNEVKTLKSQNAQQRAELNLMEANFSRTVQQLSGERDRATQERATHLRDATATRQENTRMKEQIIIYTRKCKEDFSKSLEGIQTVTSAFLARINNLFPHHLTFHLTCQKQQEQMEKIRTSCTNLSREVEDRFQKYLNNVGDEVANIQVQYSALAVKSSHLNSDLQACELTRAGLAAESAQKRQEAQQTHDTRMRTVLMDQNHLRQEKDKQSQRLVVMEAEAQTLRATIQTLGSAQPNCKQQQQGQVTKQAPGSG